MEIVFYVLFVVILVAQIRIGRSVVIFVPLVNLILDLSFNVFEGSGFTSSGISIPALVRLIFYMFIIIAYIPYLKDSIRLNFTYTFLIYVFFIVLTSPYLFTSLKNYSMLVFSLMMFPIGYLYFDKLAKINNYIVVIKYVLIIFSINFALGFIFNIGTKSFDYDETEGTIGFIEAGGAIAGALLFCYFPLIFMKEKKLFQKIILFTFGFILLISLTLTARRTVVLMVLVGFMIYFALIRHKMRFGIYLSFGLLILLAASPFFIDKLLKNVQIREDQGRFNSDFYESEGRYWDIINPIEKSLSFENFEYSIKGEIPFAKGGYVQGFRIGRIIHNDFGVFLDGTGLVGLILYLLVITSSVFFIRKIKYTNLTDDYSKIYISYIISVALLFLVSINGSYNNISYRSALFLSMGGFLRILYDNQKLGKPIIISSESGYKKSVNN